MNPRTNRTKKRKQVQRMRARIYFYKKEALLQFDWMKERGFDIENYTLERIEGIMKGIRRNLKDRLKERGHYQKIVFLEPEHRFYSFTPSECLNKPIDYSQAGNKPTGNNAQEGIKTIQKYNSQQ